MSAPFRNIRIPFVDQLPEIRNFLFMFIEQLDPRTYDLIG